MYKLRISPEARNDLIEVKAYIAQELSNLEAAQSLVSKIMNRIRGLLDFPEMGSSLSSVIDIETGYRFLVCESYLIFYRFENGVVYVLRILYSRRDYVRVLFSDLPEE